MNPEERRFLAWPREILKVGMASFDACHSRNGAKSGGRFFKWVAMGCLLERKPIRKVVQGFARSRLGLRNE
ncbi:hypothetical protein VitviT2T_019837 [Vitis vinifera]|uniref:DUF4283 domain-containing protein n=1 Tax=Vitis vinifera TaxID=29760 RepID=A0ABY9D3Y4_VITVI|nr:hypothetical protein VitviT2T_019837 [Vitis vinifera]